jgi:hypothetical protein
VEKEYFSYCWIHRVNQLIIQEDSAEESSEVLENNRSYCWIQKVNQLGIHLKEDRAEESSNISQNLSYYWIHKINQFIIHLKMDTNYAASQH